MDLAASATDFMQWVTACPTPRHTVAEATRRLERAGFAAGTPAAGGKGFLARAGSLIAWREGDEAAPLRVITAHTDSPNLRIKPRPDHQSANSHQLGVEIYGGVLLNSWLDRELGVAGHAVVQHDGMVEERLVTIDRPVLRIPQLAIHLDREIYTKGLQLNKQQHMMPIWGLAGVDDERGFVDLLAAELGVDSDQVLAFELMTHDVTPPSVWGWDEEFIASPRIDNQLSCWAGIDALTGSDSDGTVVVALFDHEEVGSVSATGAGGRILTDALDELVTNAAAGSLVISADCAHATHPNYADRHDGDHQITLNGGPVIKVNANERYATTPMGHATFAQACDRAGVPHQVFVNRSDLACGSTVGPVTAARTGLETVDVGAPQLAMHSARETTGSSDPGYLAEAIAAVLQVS